MICCNLAFATPQQSAWIVLRLEGQKIIDDIGKPKHSVCIGQDVIEKNSREIIQSWYLRACVFYQSALAVHT